MAYKQCYKEFIMDKLIFRGKMKDFREFFLKKWCEQHNIDTEKWSYVGPSLMNGVKVKGVKDGYEYKMTSGSSGCKFMMVDKTGGHHSFLQHDTKDYEYYENSL
jgi:hypothetical protein